MKTFTLVKIEVFKTPTGRRTCASDFTSGKFCQFLRTSGFGSNDSCVFQTGRRPTLIRVDGFLEPCSTCILEIKNE